MPRVRAMKSATCLRRGWLFWLLALGFQTGEGGVALVGTVDVRAA
jgi:hypothetical protein